MRPWKDPVKARISDFSGPWCAWACLRASLIAASTLSVPELQKKTLSKPVASCEHLRDLGLDGDLVEVGAVDQGPCLLLYGLHQRRMAVTQRVGGDAPR